MARWGLFKMPSGRSREDGFREMSVEEALGGACNCPDKRQLRARTGKWERDTARRGGAGA